jgi:hypothetical protein
MPTTCITGCATTVAGELPAGVGWTCEPWLQVFVGGRGPSCIAWFTAPRGVDPSDSPSAYTDQDIYLKALKAHKSINVLELGRYVAWAKSVPLANSARSGGVQVIRPSGAESWSGIPIQAKTAADGSQLLLATVRIREEKGSDVNVATHLLAYVFRGEVDAAIVISNDSDLALPLEIARTLVPQLTLAQNRWPALFADCRMRAPVGTGGRSCQHASIRTTRCRTRLTVDQSRSVGERP